MALLESITTSSIWNNGCLSLHELLKVEQEGIILSFFVGHKIGEIGSGHLEEEP